MEIRNEEQARECCEAWSVKSVKVQRSLLLQAKESLELGQLYYENKDNQAGVQRLGNCITLLQSRLKDLDEE
ncbi:MAG: hypothetical protein KKE17_11620 [Proteobacteria bacterium]|nr:hypothetical protein [Pseudomonadota bacterium]MBU1710643.1 hypothetical protein [Pseudomonadota bacterium]